MIEVFKSGDLTQGTTYEVKDYRDLLGDNEVLCVRQRDAVKLTRVLGTKNTTIQEVVWKPARNTQAYKDWLVTIK